VADRGSFGKKKKEGRRIQGKEGSELNVKKKRILVAFSRAGGPAKLGTWQKKKRKEVGG